MDVTRKEDGFDLSGPQEPKRAYPPLKMVKNYYFFIDHNLTENQLFLIVFVKK